MKRKLLTLVSLSLLLSLAISLVGCSQKTVDRGLPVARALAMEGEGVTHHYLVLGDSIAAHHGVEEKDSYYHLLGEALSQNGESWKGENWGVSGARVLDLLNSLREKKADPKDRETFANAELITISIGGNDILDFLRKNGVDLLENKSGDWLKTFGGIKGSIDTFCEELRGEIALVIKEIREANPVATILFQNIYNVARDMEGKMRILGKEFTPRQLLEPVFIPIRRILEEEAKNLGYTVADTYSAFEKSEERPLLRPELIHPNEAGHALICKVLFDTYQSLKAK